MIVCKVGVVNNLELYYGRSFVKFLCYLLGVWGYRNRLEYEDNFSISMCKIFLILMNCMNYSI